MIRNFKLVIGGILFGCIKDFVTFIAQIRQLSWIATCMYFGEGFLNKWIGDASGLNLDMQVLFFYGSSRWLGLGLECRAIITWKGIGIHIRLFKILSYPIIHKTYTFMFFVNLGMYASNTFIYRIEKYQDNTNDHNNDSIVSISGY